MTAITKGEPDLAAVQEDLAALKRDVARLIEHLRASATNGAQSAAGQLDEAAQRLYRTVSGEGERSVKAVSQKIEEQPLTALLIALGVGYFAGACCHGKQGQGLRSRGSGSAPPSCLTPDAPN